MADIGILPVANVGWSVVKAPTFQTRIQRAVSGRELRALDYPFPLWQFTLTFEYLTQALWQNLCGFFLACQGAFATFLFDDPSDDTLPRPGYTGVPVPGGYFGSSDGVTSVFQLARGLGDLTGVVRGFIEPVTAPGQVQNVYIGGSPAAPGSYAVDPATGLVTFASPPPAGNILSWAGTYYFRCRFVDDSQNFEEFMYLLWNLKQLKFISARP